MGDLWVFETPNVARRAPISEEPPERSLEHHARRMEADGRVSYRCELPAATDHGTFFPLHAFETDDIGRLPGEVFGPVLHVIRYRADTLDQVIDSINGTGYGLIFGIHSRIDRTVDYLSQRVHAGNLYVNRSMVGAVVGVQPFGGEGLPGTGPKAGDPITCSDSPPSAPYRSIPPQRAETPRCLRCRPMTANAIAVRSCARPIR
ncbi:MAG: aldehyde dehydrogenase family protein [Chromatiaceae bacterium]